MSFFYYILLEMRKMRLNDSYLLFFFLIFFYWLFEFLLGSSVCIERSIIFYHLLILITLFISNNMKRNYWLHKHSLRYVVRFGWMKCNFKSYLFIYLFSLWLLEFGQFFCICLLTTPIIFSIMCNNYDIIFLLFLTLDLFFYSLSVSCLNTFFLLVELICSLNKKKDFQLVVFPMYIPNIFLSVDTCFYVYTSNGIHTISFMLLVFLSVIYLLFLLFIGKSI